MRVISGKAKGTKLRSVAGLTTRPTSDRVKEALFNILGLAIREKHFLDLYAGNGGIGLEALSRGAKSVVWIDSNPACARMIRLNQEKTRLTKGRIFTNDVLRALVQLHKKGENFDFIFLDPPYKQGLLNKTLFLLNDLALLDENGIIIAEASKKEDAPGVMSKFRLVRKNNYGDTILYFYQHEGEVE